MCPVSHDLYGDTCASVKQKSYIDNTLFKSLNPAINSQCTNTVLRLAYCIFSIYAPDASVSTGPPANVAPGTILEGCTQYYTVASGDGCAPIESKNLALAEAHYVVTCNSTSTGSPSNLASGTITAGYTIASRDGCGTMETEFNLALARLIAINLGCSNLALAEAYCVASSNSTSTAPSSLAERSLANWIVYATVASGMDTRAKIAFADFLRWNPEIVIRTNIQLAEAYCVSGGRRSMRESGYGAER
ncbi:hypothetical protein B0H11DRAFT_2274616 [Mycena galericulata]|nr:hypothetical protein B0H11DRAFT_2274616 [Mycena galericulata]